MVNLTMQVMPALEGVVLVVVVMIEGGRGSCWCVQDTHAHGNGHADLFLVVHVESEQEPPGQ